MQMEFDSYAEAEKRFLWKDRWSVFSRGRDQLNIAFECVDRHPGENTAIRLKNTDGRTETYTFGELSRYTSQFACLLEENGNQRR